MSNAPKTTEDKQRAKFEYIIWIVCNICIPMAPFLFKWILTRGSTNEAIQKLTILEPSELLYYSFILCWIFICDIVLKNEKPVVGLILSVISAIVSIVNVIAIITTYSEGKTSDFTRIYSYVVTIIIILTASIYKYQKEGKSNAA